MSGFYGPLTDIGTKGYYHLNGRYVDAAAHHVTEYFVFEEGKVELMQGGDNIGLIAQFFE